MNQAQLACFHADYFAALESVLELPALQIGPVEIVRGIANRKADVIAAVLGQKGWNLSSPRFLTALPEAILFDSFITDVKALIADAGNRNYVQLAIDAGKLIQDGGNLLKSITGAQAPPKPPKPMPFTTTGSCCDQFLQACVEADKHDGKMEALPFGGALLTLALQALAELLTKYLATLTPAPVK